MRKHHAVFAVCLVGLLLWQVVATSQNVAPTENQLVGTWEMTSPKLPEEYRDLKHITPTHFTWVIYERDKMVPVHMAGGTWSLRDGVYREKIDFASGKVEHLRGKEYSFTVKLEGDKLIQKSTPETEIHVDEVWTRTSS